MIKKIRTIQIGEPDSISIILVGCGGTGSFAALNLARLAWAARSGKRFRLTFIDPDVVEEKNIGRQYFCPADVGQPKAWTLARRLGSQIGAAFAEAFVLSKLVDLGQAEN
jgi:molybdopterin/thiamine biosynthesis adenylyltransferase